MLARNTRAPVNDRDRNRAVFARHPTGRLRLRHPARLHTDGPLGVAVLDRVVDQVEKHLGELVAVADHGRQAVFGVDGNGHAALFRLPCERVVHVGEQRGERHRFGRRRVLVHLDA